MQRLSPFTLIVTFVCLALVGLALVPMLPVKLNPSRTLPGFTVRFSMPGTSSRVVEMEATSKLESMLARIKGVKAMYSTSGNGYGSITVVWINMRMWMQYVLKLPQSFDRRGRNYLPE